MKGGFTNYYDKVSSKYADTNSREFREGGVRVVPPATARKGAYIASGVVLMPSYVNIGAYVDSGTMVDTWATVGSCAQIGSHVHLSGGVGIGGVLEPLQATPTIIEDDCFIGARSEVVEGVIIGKGSVLSMGVYIGKSTRIYDRESGKFEELTGHALPLGVSETTVYQKFDKKIVPGQIVMMGTDGIWEAQNPTGEMFGKERFMDIVRENAERSAKDITQSVIKHVNSFCHPLEKADDVTLVVTKIT